MKQRSHEEEEKTGPISKLSKGESLKSKRSTSELTFCDLPISECRAARPESYPALARASERVKWHREIFGELWTTSFVETSSLSGMVRKFFNENICPSFNVRTRLDSEWPADSTLIEQLKLW